MADTEDESPCGNLWEGCQAVGREIIYDRYSIPATEVSRSDFLANPEYILKEEPTYIVNASGSDWLVMTADHYYGLLAKLEEATRNARK
ncbi:hypothetical protein U9S86_004546 [Salmonella enterica]|nr:hypothetical protein [Salmonella enterica]EHA9546161.1 hypothetical protein [Salmonella enterica subsp. enterica serovar Braenderup]EBH4941543.1 hypothetical protein [Salmonella enterica]ECK3278467.1 hypothetical protein [Salmonella enterica]ECK6358135.1 hypothetical protein [Salmonella enterica]